MSRRQPAVRWATIAPIAAVLGCNLSSRSEVQSPANEVEHQESTASRDGTAQPDAAAATEEEEEDTGCPPGSVHIESCCGFVPGCCGPAD